MKLEVIKAEDYGLTEKQGFEISGKFKVLEEEKKLLVLEYNEIIKKELTSELSSEAKLLDNRMQKHLKAKKDIHTANKSFFLNGGRFVDSIYNVEKVEFDLMRDATKKIKNYAEDLEKERIAKIQCERVSLLSEFIEDASERDLASMEDDVWDFYLAGKKQSNLDKIQEELDSEKKRQAKIKAEKEEQELIIKENAKLKSDAEEIERLAKIEADKREKAEQERKEKEDAERKIREEKERKERAEHEYKLKAERKAKEKLESELQYKKEVEQKAKEYEEKRLQDELNKGDEAKVKDLINDLELLKTKYTFKAVKTQKMYADVGLLIDKVTNHVKK